MFEVKIKETKTKLITLSGVFIINFEECIIVIKVTPVDFTACFSILIVDSEHVFTKWKCINLVEIFFLLDNATPVFH